MQLLDSDLGRWPVGTCGWRARTRGHSIKCLSCSKSADWWVRRAAMDNLIRMVNRSAQGVILFLVIGWLFSQFLLAW